jgi:hypothetical protein
MAAACAPNLIKSLLSHVFSLFPLSPPSPSSRRLRRLLHLPGRGGAPRRPHEAGRRGTDRHGQRRRRRRRRHRAPTLTQQQQQPAPHPAAALCPPGRGHAPGGGRLPAGPRRVRQGPTDGPGAHDSPGVRGGAGRDGTPTSLARPLRPCPTLPAGRPADHPRLCADQAGLAPGLHPARRGCGRGGRRALPHPGRARDRVPRHPPPQHRPPRRQHPRAAPGGWWRRWRWGC